jgi:hypothetical protein
MKKLLLVAVLMSGLAVISMAQTHPSKKASSTTTATTKTETKRDSVGGATSSHMGKHKSLHKKGAHKKS